ncbi:hypothetical protein SAMD00024442_20_30 [Candidatus Symbiothrix dinenymphae]|nr:hypothetical protein SAMD00024442_20_30 [Candidatus Symbiothrix dinenymphae]
MRKNLSGLAKFSAYKIDLIRARQEVQTFEYLLDSQFFADIESDDVQKGKVKVSLTVTDVRGTFVFDFKLSGNVVIACDRCLDEMNFPIETTAKLVVKLGTEYAEGADDVITIPEKEGFINIAWFLYEFVALEIPLKHVHAKGQCNRDMEEYLKKHVVTSGDDDEEDIIDKEESDNW